MKASATHIAERGRAQKVSRSNLRGTPDLQSTLDAIRFSRIAAAGRDETANT